MTAPFEPTHPADLTSPATSRTGEVRAAEPAEFTAFTFEQLLDELERVTQQIEDRDIGIEAAAELYERAGRLHEAASERLAAVESRIRGIDERRDLSR